jgi:hypothetical protein
MSYIYLVSLNLIFLMKFLKEYYRIVSNLKDLLILEMDFSD